MPKRTDKNRPREELARYKSLEETTVMKKLQKLSLFGAVAGTLIVTGALAPSAHAATLTVFNFENLAAQFAFNNGAHTPYPADAGQAGVTLNRGPDDAFPFGQSIIRATGGNPSGVLDLNGNPNTQYCFSIGAINTTGQADVTLSFDLMSQPGGNGGGEFSTLKLGYSTTGAAGSFLPVGTTGTYNGTTGFTDLKTHTTYFNYVVDLSAGGVPNSSTLYVEFCFSGQKNDAEPNHTFIDNISVTAVPEPTTAVSGVLAVLAVFGLCWSQRRCLIHSLRLRRT
jgi:hypothetical protein